MLFSHFSGNTPNITHRLIDVPPALYLINARLFLCFLSPLQEDYIPYLTDVQAPRIFAFTKTSAQVRHPWTIQGV